MHSFPHRLVFSMTLTAELLALAACGGGGGSAGTAGAALATPTNDCVLQGGAPGAQTAVLLGGRAMVSSADGQASMAGCRVLARGGSAADAAVAVQAVLGVVEPMASGLGGGTVATYYDAASGRVLALDGLSASPGVIGDAATHYEVAVADDRNCRAGLTDTSSIASQQGHTNISGRAVGVPGTVRLLDRLHALHGRMPWNTLWDDAIGLARNGFPMTPYMHATLYTTGGFDDETGAVLAAGGVPSWVNSAQTHWGPARCKYRDIRARYCDPTDAASQRPLPVGSTLHNPELALTMERVRDGGAAAFYDPNGPIVAAILQRFREDRVQADGVTNNCTATLPSTAAYAAGTADPVPARIPSLMRAEDFAQYRAVERRPLVAARFGLSIHTQPAPLFGGVVLLYGLGVMEQKDTRQHAFGSAPMLHAALESSRMANADRRNVVGDPAFSNTDVRVAALLSPAYIASRAALVGNTALGTVPRGGAADGIPDFSSMPSPVVFNAQRRRTMLASAGRPARGEDWNTTSSIAIADAHGNVLAMTTTINTHWGAHIEAAGMLLNNAMSNFSTGAIGSDVNGYAAAKRPRSGMGPSIAFDAGGAPRLAWGSAGGGAIPDYVTKVFLAHAVYGMDLQAALNADNWSGQDVDGSGNPIGQLEAGTPVADLAATLRSTYGYSTTSLRATSLRSGLAAIALGAGGGVQGAADRRRNGAAAGY